MEKFREVYEALYNSADSSRDMVDIKVKIAELITAESAEEVKKITGAKVKEAAGMMKGAKADVSGGFSSDAILNAPDLMFEQLAAVYRSWLMHDSVTPILLACAFMPLCSERSC